MYGSGEKILSFIFWFGAFVDVGHRAYENGPKGVFLMLCET